MLYLAINIRFPHTKSSHGGGLIRRKLHVPGASCPSDPLGLDIDRRASPRLEPMDSPRPEDSFRRLRIPSATRGPRPTAHGPRPTGCLLPQGRRRVRPGNPSILTGQPPRAPPDPRMSHSECAGLHHSQPGPRVPGRDGTRPPGGRETGLGEAFLCPRNHNGLPPSTAVIYKGSSVPKGSGNEPRKPTVFQRFLRGAWGSEPRGHSHRPWHGDLRWCYGMARFEILSKFPVSRPF